MLCPTALLLPTVDLSVRGRALNRWVNDGNTGGAESRRAGYILAITSSIASGVSIVIGKWNLAAISPLLMSSIIFSVASVVMGGALLSVKGVRNVFTLTKEGWFWLVIFSVGSWLAIWAYWAGIQRMDPSLAAFLSRSEVLVAIVFGMVLLRERFTRLELIGAILSIAGTVIMRVTLRAEYTTGFSLVLIGSLIFGTMEFVSKIAVRHVDPVILTFIRNTLVALLFWATLSATGISFDGLGDVWPGVIALSITAPIMARALYLLALKRLELSKVAVISQSQPIYVILISLLALGQLPTLREASGGIFIVIGCLFLVVSRNRHL